MKKKIILLTAAIMLFGIMTVKAQETVDTSGQDWNDIVKSYNKNTIDRPITPQEFNQAVQTIKGLQKPPKKEKKHWWNFGKKSKKEEAPPLMQKEPVANEVLPSGDPLLRLYSDVNVNGTTVNKGFYLVDYVLRDKIYYLRLKQGSDKYTEIEAKQSSDAFFQGKDVETEYTPERKVKIIYRFGSIQLAAEADAVK
jgi:hypothetical protein